MTSPAAATPSSRADDHHLLDNQPTETSCGETAAKVMGIVVLALIGGSIAYIAADQIKAIQEVMKPLYWAIVGASVFGCISLLVVFRRQPDAYIPEPISPHSTPPASPRIAPPPSAPATPATPSASPRIAPPPSAPATPATPSVFSWEEEPGILTALPVSAPKPTGSENPLWMTSLNHSEIVRSFVELGARALIKDRLLTTRDATLLRGPICGYTALEMVGRAHLKTDCDGREAVTWNPADGNALQLRDAVPQIFKANGSRTKQTRYAQDLLTDAEHPCHIVRARKQLVALGKLPSYERITEITRLKHALYSGNPRLGEEPLGPVYSEEQREQFPPHQVIRPRQVVADLAQLYQDLTAISHALQRRYLPAVNLVSQDNRLRALPRTDGGASDIYAHLSPIYSYVGSYLAKIYQIGNNCALGMTRPELTLPFWRTVHRRAALRLIVSAQWLPGPDSDQLILSENLSCTFPKVAPQGTLTLKNEAHLRLAALQGGQVSAAEYEMEATLLFPLNPLTSPEWAGEKRTVFREAIRAKELLSQMDKATQQQLLAQIDYELLGKKRDLASCTPAVREAIDCLDAVATLIEQRYWGAILSRVTIQYPVVVADRDEAAPSLPLPPKVALVASAPQTHYFSARLTQEFNKTKREIAGVRLNLVPRVEHLLPHPISPEEYYESFEAGQPMQIHKLSELVTRNFVLVHNVTGGGNCCLAALAQSIFYGHHKVNAAPLLPTPDFNNDDPIFDALRESIARYLTIRWREFAHAVSNSREAWATVRLSDTELRAALETIYEQQKTRPEEWGAISLRIQKAYDIEGKTLASAILDVEAAIKARADFYKNSTEYTQAPELYAFSQIWQVPLRIWSADSGSRPQLLRDGSLAPFQAFGEQYDAEPIHLFLGGLHYNLLQPKRSQGI